MLRDAPRQNGRERLHARVHSADGRTDFFLVGVLTDKARSAGLECLHDLRIQLKG